MTRAAHELLEEALQLPEDDRASLVARLLDSLEPESDADRDAAWEAEIQRRMAELDSGAVKAVPWPEALRRIESDEPSKD